ncbi:hypothetical protein ACB092_03G097800 [Castanea dentata]
MDYYYHILVTWAMPLMIFLINLRLYPIRLVLLHPHDLEAISVKILFYHHIVNRSHHHHQLHPPTASSNVVESYFKIPHQQNEYCHHQHQHGLDNHATIRFITVSINMIVVCLLPLLDFKGYG